MNFEYHVDLVLAPIIPKEMNRLGRDGWEMVSASFAPQRGWYYVFKRPIPDYVAAPVTGTVPVVQEITVPAPQAAARGPIYLAWDYAATAFRWLCGHLRALWAKLKRMV